MSIVYMSSASGIDYEAPVTLAVRGFARPRSVPLVDLVGRDGAVVPGRASLAPRRGTLEGSLRAATHAAAQALLDQLLAVLGDAPLQLRLGNPTSRYLTIYPEDVDDTLTEWPSWVRVRVPLVAPDPHWYAHTLTTVQLASASQNVTNEGNAPVAPIIRVTGGSGGATAIQIGNGTTGQQVTFSGTLSNGQVLLIDCERRTAVRGGQNVLTLVNQGFKVNGFDLRPGNNTITRSVSGAATVQLEYRPRWL